MEPLSPFFANRARRVGIPRRSHVDSRYSGISLRVDWKIGMSRLPRLDGRCGAIVMGYPCEQARGYPITTAPPPTGVQACPCRKSLRVKLPFGHKIEHTAHIVHRYRLQYFMRSAQFYAKRFSSWAGLTPKVWVCGTGVGRASLLARDPPPCHRPIAP